ncbi:MAG: DUF1294 domain-containing protein [Clostridia bacterium]|nr:DUF1294 domain-containing protein [Clostridia bacterium]
MIKYIILIYFLLISVVSIVVTVHDKNAAKKNKWRVKESTLLFLGFIGGAVFMLLTMLVIRHKTKKARFMVPLPLFAIIQIVALVLAFMYL